ncbi:MAG: RagB/SusD family nutrient uptake outer membrane protein [Balneolaceae bacterium]
MLYKKNHIKILLALFVVTSIGTFASCEDQLLNKSPRGERNEATFFDNEEDAIHATNATYSQLVKFDRSPQPFWSSVNHIWYLGLTDIASDDANEGTEPTDGPDVRLIDNVDYRAGEGPFAGMWEWHYRIIFRANNAIQNIPNIDMENVELQERLIAENKFIRAHAYFFLVNAWGGVPLITKPLEPGEFEQPKVSAEEVFALIEQDLRDGIEALPVVSDYPASEVGRASKGAAQGYLAKVLLFQEKYGEAQERAEDVINSGDYGLLSDYDQIFTTEGENSSESLFEIQAAAYADMSGGTTFSNPQGVRGQPNLGWGFNSPERDLLNDYEPGDQRMQSTVLFVHENLPRGPEDVVRDNPNMIDERYNQKSFIPKENAGSIPNMNGGNNIRILRYSDVLLIAAEAAYRNNDAGAAQGWLNDVRERARNGHEATIGIIPESLAGLIADTLGIPEMEGQPFIRWVNPGGVGEDAGLEFFEWELVDGNRKILVNNIDIIEAVDGVALSSLEEFNEEMRSKSAGESITVDVLRVTEEFDGDNKQTDTEELQINITTEALLPDITASGQQLLDAIWHERRMELALEQLRMWDIRRQGRAGELLRAQGKNFEDGVNEVYPIPRNETQLNPALQQNNGYN